MKVVVKEREYEYESDYPEGWHSSSGDKFKFPVFLNKHKCFVKRFENKNPENISGWELLQSLKGKYEHRLPRIYDIVSTEEQKKTVYYLFFEFISGFTLDRSIAKKKTIDLLQLTNDLFSALKTIHKYNFWFPDFCEKNIFWDELGKRYLLIDLDSSQPASELPQNVMYGDKIYWGLVYNFYKEVLGFQEIKSEDIPGPVLNYLQVVLLVLRLKMTVIDKVYDYNQEDIFNILPAYLDRANPVFQEIFANAYEDAGHLPRLSWVNKIREAIIQHIIDSPLPYPQPEAADIPVISATAVHPEIHYFIASDYELEAGMPLTLYWKVEHTKTLKLYRNKIFYRDLGIADEHLTVIEDSQEHLTEVTYSLLASNGSDQVESHPLVIRFMAKPLAEMDIPLDPNLSEPVAEEYLSEPVAAEYLSETSEEEDNGSRDPELQETLEEEYNGPEITGKKKARIKISFPVWLVLLVIVLAITGILYMIYRKPAPENIVSEKITILPISSGITEGQALIIFGRNFPTDTSQVQVYFNQVKGRVTTSSEDTLEVLVPRMEAPAGNRNVTVAVVANGDTAFSNTFIEKIRIYNFASNTSEGKIVKIPGDNFPTDPSKVQVYFNRVPGRVIRSSGDTLEVLVPKLGTQLGNGNVTVAVVSGGDTASSNILINPVATHRPVKKPVPPGGVKKTVSGSTASSADLETSVTVVSKILTQHNGSLSEIQYFDISIINNSPSDLDEVIVKITYQKLGEQREKNYSITGVKANDIFSKEVPVTDFGYKGDHIFAFILSLSIVQIRQAQ